MALPRRDHRQRHAGDSQQAVPFGDPRLAESRKFYYGLVKITAPGALNSPKFLVTVLNVADAATAAIPDPSPSGLFFVGKAGIALDPTAGPSIRLFTSSSTPVPFQASANTSDGAAWLSVTPLSGTTSTAAPASVNVSVNPIRLAPGVYTGDVTFAFSSTQIRTVNVTLVVQPSTASSALKTLSAVTGCAPAKLALTQTGLTNSFAAPAGWPTPLIVQLANDCGDPVLNGQVVATFSNGDPPSPCDSPIQPPDSTPPPGRPARLPAQ